MAYTKYSLTPANNTAAPPDGAPEGMLPSAVNDTMRDMMAQIRDVGDGIRNGTYTMTAPVITGGSITGVTMTSSSVSATSLTDSGNLTFTGTGNRITGDFSNATIANRVMFQTSTTNSATTVSVIPNGTSQIAGFNVFNNSDPTNSSLGGFSIPNGIEVRLAASATGTGTSLPLTMYTGGSERLRIETDGDVSIGTSTQVGGVRFTVVGGGIQLSGGTTAQEGVRIQRASGVASFTGINNDNNAYNALSFATSATEAMRIDTSGNVGIGTSSPAVPLDVQASSGAMGLQIRGRSSDGIAYMRFSNNAANAFAYIGSTAGTNMYFEANGSERMRIDSSGNLLVGATALAGDERLNVTKNVADQEIFRCIPTNNSTPWGMTVSYTAADPNGTSSWFYSAVANGTVRFNVRSNGGIGNYSANNVNLSDAREKTNIELAGSYLDKICAIPVKTFNYIDQNREEDDGLTLGVIAQDVQKVAPELVMESNWAGKDQPEKMRLSIYQTDLQYALMKCIQEQQAMIEELKQEVAALKAK